MSTNLLKRAWRTLRPSPADGVDFYAATWIDEIWVRSTIESLCAAGLRPRLSISGDNSRWPASLVQRYESLRVPLTWAPKVEILHGLRMRRVVTASSAIPRSFFGDTLAHLIHMPHSLASLHAIYPDGAFDGYDTLFAAGPHHGAEFQRLAHPGAAAPGRVFAVGYGKFDVMAPPADPPPAGPHGVLIAPSWGEHNLIKILGVELVGSLLDLGLAVTLRPHPSFFFEQAPELDAVLARHDGHAGFQLEESTGESRAMWSADLLISDYSGTALEFAALRRRPVLFVDLPRKIVNQRWRELDLEPMEVACRNSVGRVCPPRCDDAVAACSRMLADGEPALPGSAIERFCYRPARVSDAAVAALEQLH